MKDYPMSRESILGFFGACLTGAVYYSENLNELSKKYYIYLDYVYNGPREMPEVVIQGAREYLCACDGASIDILLSSILTPLLIEFAHKNLMRTENEKFNS